MSTVATIYSNGSQECERMAALLEALDGDFHKYELGIHFSDRQFHNEFGEEAEYPQCSIGMKHVGNMHDTLHYMKSHSMFN
ncbi:glutaredoxin [Synechococcus phage S-ShM2]|uniref:Glutaredoxin n=3 Tax=Ahtivirus sagseatwo TaxID=2734079 RepID=A0A1D7SIN4_9CAUD|nr:glutaredoxin [Synechococcus phage S-ShM2]AGH57412.1 hypothetical protein CPLG_00158 [Cyanophage S-SSM2]AOO13254.1 hypothetical protein LIS021110_140 [Cyanophage S-RIM14]ADO97761.1 glutaredoxin [Synechococcus phage S-ShM2]AOO13470.1 hypothetical protein LIS110610_140 [Cyanophage S-RIM14]AOO13686.1 hypothetical protein Np111211_140 [Cyanophage S-RIM14]